MVNVDFADSAFSKMKTHGVSEHQALDTFNSGKVEKYGSGMNVIKKYSGYEIGVFCVVDTFKKYKILSVWKRLRR